MMFCGWAEKKMMITYTNQIYITCTETNMYTKKASIKMTIHQRTNIVQVHDPG